MNSYILRQDSVLSSYKKQLGFTFFWNLFDTILTQGFLILHNVLIRNFFGSEFHGQFGSLLAFFYFLVAICNLGLNRSIAPHINTIINSKKNFRSFLIWHIVPHIFFLLFCILFASGIIFYFKVLSFENTILISIIALAFLFESIKKIGKSFLQLTLYTIITSLTEVIGIILYLIIVWAIYYIGFPFSLTLSWIVLFIISFFQMSVFIITIFSIYKNLKSNQTKQNNLTLNNSSIIKTRFFGWSYQLCSEICNTNFLVPLCAIYFGQSQASFFKIISAISQWINLIIQKGFGISSVALLTNTKSILVTTQKKIFSLLSFILHHLIYLILIFILINGKKIILSQATQTNTLVTWIGLYLMITLTITDAFSTVYQSWFIVQNKINYLFLFYSLGFLIVYLLHYSFSSFLNLSIFLSVISIFRILFFLILIFYSYFKWGLSPEIKINPRVVTLAFFISFLVYLYL